MFLDTKWPRVESFRLQPRLVKGPHEVDAHLDSVLAVDQRPVSLLLRDENPTIALTLENCWMVSNASAVVPSSSTGRTSSNPSSRQRISTGVVEVALANRAARSGVAHEVVLPVEVVTCFTIGEPLLTDGLERGGGLNADVLHSIVDVVE